MATLLYVDGLTVSFDGFLALTNLNLILERDEKIRLLIGPNGAGKTTLFDVLTGQVEQSPTLLLLDEPVAGMTRAEKERTVEILAGIVEDSACTVMLIEHDMEFVRQVARGGHRVTVLHEGHVLSEGSLDRVQTDERVIEAYLGRGRIAVTTPC